MQVISATQAMRPFRRLMKLLQELPEAPTQLRPELSSQPPPLPATSTLDETNQIRKKIRKIRTDTPAASQAWQKFLGLFDSEKLMLKLASSISEAANGSPLRGQLS